MVVRRDAHGWHVQVGGRAEPVDGLADALTLADLLTDGHVPGPRPPRPVGPQDELERLQASVRQLEHALASRVLVEQAIGVLTERWKVPPREAFEQLRRVTRSRGLRIHELARTVVDSCTDKRVRLPAELVAATGSVTPPQPRRSPERPDERSAGTEPRQRQRGRRRGNGTPRPREQYGETAGQGRDAGPPVRSAPPPPHPGPPPAGGSGTFAAGAAAVARTGSSGRT